MTTLSAGDIALVSFNADSDDQFQFVVLVDIAAGTQVNFTDNGWQDSGEFRKNEGKITWQSQEAIAAGTVVAINPTLGTTSNGSISKSGSLNISGSGDAIIAYQGEDTNPHLLFALNQDRNGWSNATDSNTTALPTGLIDGESALTLPHQDNLVYVGITSGSKTEILAAITDSTNWSGENKVVQTFSQSRFTLSDSSNPVDPVDPTDPTEPSITLISTIQGEGENGYVPYSGQVVTIEAIVTSFTPDKNGFYLQEEVTDSDGNIHTSEGMFVYFADTNPGISATNIGDTVQVQGTIGDYQGNTQMSYVQQFTVTKDGDIADVPEPIKVQLPLPNAVDLESLENMLVTFSSANDEGSLVVTDTYNLGRYGQLTLTSDELQVQFTEINTPDADGYAAYLKALKNDQIILDDNSGKQNPDSLYGRGGEPLSADNPLRAGDSVESVTGVLDQFIDARAGQHETSYRIQPTEQVNFTGEARPTAELLHNQIGEAEITVASANVLNFFTTCGRDTFQTPMGNTMQGRGADNADEYSRQLDKLVSMLSGLDADVVGLMEIQNNGYGQDSAIAALVDALNAALGAGTYAYISGPFSDGSSLQASAGSDAIMVGMLYKPEAVTPVGDAVVPNVDDYPAFDGGNRVPVAQAFESNQDGEVFTVVVNHFKSKGSVIDADQGDGQGNNPQTRLEAAEDLAAWLATDPTGTGDTDNLLIGDFNGYAKEEALTYLDDHGHDHLTHDYSYSYDGLWGSLDHAFASDSLASQITGVADWSINANESTVLDYNTNFKSDAQQQSYYDSSAYRASDHNPVLIGLNLGDKSPSDPVNPDPTAMIEIKGTVSDDNLVGNELDNLIYGFEGNDRLDGGTGADLLIGGTGNDSYIVDNVDDQVVELKGTDIDAILTYVNYSLKDTHVENIIAIGHEAIKLIGNDEDNIMTGNEADNTLVGADGNDTLNGAGGADKMYGGQGDDIYYVDHAKDSVTELWWSGHDTVMTTVDFDLRTGSIEDATTLGSADISLKGNWSDNVLTGNEGNNVLEGRLGDDTLIGGLGQDTLIGGWGKDTFVFTDVNESSLSAADVIKDFTSGQDKIDLSQIDANSTTTEEDQFFIMLNRDQAFTEAGELKFVDGVLYGNTNNDAIADFAIDLKGPHLAMTDIII